MNRILFVIFSLLAVAPIGAQEQSGAASLLSLDSCRSMALRSNKQMSLARVKKDVAVNVRKAARTKYLPHIDLAGGYMYSSRELSLLSDDQKNELNSMGTIAVSGLKSQVNASIPQMQTGISNTLTQLVSTGQITQQFAQQFGTALTSLTPVFSEMGSQMAQQLAAAGDIVGQKIVDAYNTNTHNMFTASAILTQPIFMGGAIIAANHMADISEKMADTNIEAQEDKVLYDIDNAYWMVVSLKQKQRLADSYLNLVQKLDDDVHKMIKEGVATRADGLKVDVAVNEADMTKSKVDNGLSLAKMYLCQLCGMSLDTNITLADEDREDLDVMPIADGNVEQALQARPELTLLNQTIDLTKEQTKIARAAYLPQVALMTGGVFSNPSVYNGFERKFKGAWNIGVMVRVPVLDWGEAMYKVRASKVATNMAEIKLSEAQELIELQVSQCNFKVREANKSLVTAKKNIDRAEENLRCANLGFKEGVMQTTDVMAAQTAWMQAMSQKIDAQIDVKLAETALKKAMGEL